LERELLAIANGTPPLPPNPSGQKSLVDKAATKLRADSKPSKVMKRPAAATKPAEAVTPEPKKKTEAVTPEPKRKTAAAMSSTKKGKKETAAAMSSTKKGKKFDKDAEAKRLLKNAHSRAYHRAELQALKEGKSKEEAQALGRAAGANAMKAMANESA